MVAEPGTERGARRGRDAPSRPAARPRVASRRAVIVVALTAVCLIGLDVLTKLIAVAELSGRGPVEIIPGVLDLQLTRNSGAAFSLAGGATVFLSLIALVVVGVVVVTARRLASVGWAFVFGAMVGGAVGNLIDRMFRAPGPLRGHVVDFVHIHHWPIFNVADSAIVCGGVLAVILSLRGIGLDGTRLTAASVEPDVSVEPAAPAEPVAPGATGDGSATGEGGATEADAAVRFGDAARSGSTPGPAPDERRERPEAR